MSIPVNPLDASGVSAYKHILVAFKYSEDAVFYAKNISPNSGRVGSPLLTDAGEDIGPNVVVVNEFSSTVYSIDEAIWDFNYIPTLGVSTSTSVGKIVITERIGPSFLDFLRNSVLDVFNDGASASEVVSISHTAFVLKTIFYSETEQEPIVVNPYIFTINSIESLTNTIAETRADSHILRVMSITNTLGLIPAFSCINQLSITHVDGNLHDETPIPTGNSLAGIQTRKEENKSKRAARKERMDKSKPMKNLKEIFQSLEADLNHQKFIHKGQLQQWLRNIRTENDIDKIKVPPKQDKTLSNNFLPVYFSIDLDPEYFDYIVDNRNMPFEQPEVSQIQSGIRSFPVEAGQSILRLIYNIMLLSRRTGDDAQLPSEDSKSYKVVFTAIRSRSNIYTIHIKIRQYIVPTNDIGTNTGPGEDPEEPLQFFINDAEERDTDILSLKSKLSYDVGNSMIEEPADNFSSHIIYGDREQPTAERLATVPFFASLYSGLRPMVGMHMLDGLEDAHKAGDVLNLLDRNFYTQNTEYEMIIRGNPHLLSDVNRNPLDVLNNEDGQVFYYAKPEINPMYAKIRIFESSMNKFTENPISEEENIPNIFYFDNFYHVVKITNMFGVYRKDRSFYQKLSLRRTDTTV